MGFLRKCISIKMLLNLLDTLKLMLMVALTHLGLLKTPSQQTTDSVEEHQHQHRNNYVLVLDRLCPSIKPVPIHVMTAYIKKRLPAVEFGQVHERYTEHEDQDTVECSICLDCIDRSHEVREQCNCDHVFHWECLDRWVDQGKLTCPLCRAMLFSTMAKRTSCGDAYFERFEFLI